MTYIKLYKFDINSSYLNYDTSDSLVIMSYLYLLTAGLDLWLYLTFKQKPP